MNYNEFFLIVQNNFLYITALIFLFCITVAILFNKALPFGYYDYFHFIVSFNLASSIAVVFFLYLNGAIEVNIFLVLFLDFLILLAFFFFFLRLDFSRRIGERLSSAYYMARGTEKLFFTCAIFILLLLSLLIARNVGFSAFSEGNRFEDSKGFGAFIRVVQVLRLILIGYLAILIWRYYSARRFGRALLVFILWLGSALFFTLLGGAKADFLLFFYVSILSVCTYYKVKFNSPWPLFFSLPILIIVAVVVLHLNLKNSGIDVSATSVYIDDFPALFDRFYNRIVSNGDMYYLGLPNNVLDKIEEYPILHIFLYPVLGSGAFEKFFGYEIVDATIGKQVLLYHYPSHSLAGGPVSHYTLFLIKYFGIYFGWIGVIFFSFIISLGYSASRVSSGTISQAIFSAVLIINSYYALLQPNIGIAYLFDVIVVFSGLKIAAVFIASSIRSGNASHQPQG